MQPPTTPEAHVSEARIVPDGLPLSGTGSKPPFRWGLFGKYVVTVVSVLLLVGVVAGLAWGFKPLEQRAAAIITGHGAVNNGGLVAGKRATVRFNWPLISPVAQPNDHNKSPTARTWLPVNFQEQLTTKSQEQLNKTRDPFSPEPLAQLAAWLAATGWFDGAPTVRRDDKPGMYGVVVEAEWRIPAAVVRYDGMDRLVSWKALPMPPVGPSPNSGDLVIIGVASGPQIGDDGAIDFNQPWSADELTAALELLSTVMQQPWKDQVAAIEVQEYIRHQKVTLVTTYGTRVVWGGRPSRPLIGEASTQAKLSNIATLVRDTKRIDGGYPLVYLDGPRPMFDRSATGAVMGATTGASPIAAGGH